MANIRIYNTNPIVHDTIIGDDIPENSYFLAGNSQSLYYKTHGADLQPIIIRLKSGVVSANMALTYSEYQQVAIDVTTPQAS